MEQAVRALRLVRDEVSNSRKQSEEQHTRLQVVQAEKVALEEAVRKLQHQLQRVSHKLVQDLPKLQQQLKREKNENAALRDKLNAALQREITPAEPAQLAQASAEAKAAAEPQAEANASEVRRELDLATERNKVLQERVDALEARGSNVKELVERHRALTAQAKTVQEAKAQAEEANAATESSAKAAARHAQIKSHSSTTFIFDSSLV